MSKNEGKKEVKKRNWTFLVYPESAPANWREVLAGLRLPMAISPLHDRDKNEDGTPKKPHYHVVVCYPGPTTYQNVTSCVCDLVHSPRPFPVESMRAMYEYLWHKNEDPGEKPLYDEKQIIKLGGFRIDDYAGLTRSEIQALRVDIIGFILQNDILEYSDLLDYLQGAGMMQEFDFACSHTIMFDRYVSSRRNKRARQRDKQDA